MFGYIQYNKDALSEDDFALYRSYYCGLCKSIKQLYGVKATRILSNDLTFIEVLLSALNEPLEEVVEEKCMVNPLRKVTTRINKYDSYVAKMNVVLAYYKAVDDVHDEGRHKSMLKSLTKPFEEIKEEYPEKIQHIEQALARINQLENESCNDLDLLCNTFGRVMGEIVSYDVVFADELYSLGYHLGKFIYLMDAYDDLFEDIKKGTFNPLKKRSQDEHFDDDVKMMLEIFMGDAALSYEKLPIITYSNILRNILYSGVWAKYNQVREKRGEKKNESL